jgi:trigger factor
MTMSDSHKHGDPASTAADEAALGHADVENESQGPTGDEQAEEKQPEQLHLDVSIEKRGACQRHITVVVPREDIDRYFEREFSDLVGSAQVPGFRPGRAPRKLIEHRFKKDVSERVKGNLLMDGIAQVSQQEELSPISEPDLKLDAVELPEAGPMTFEFDLEVRPEFDLPHWKGLKIDKPVRSFTAADIDNALQNVLSRRGQLIPLEGPASAGDYISTKLTFKDGERVLSHSDEELIRIRSVLSFRDGKIEGFDKLMEGVRAGETRTAQAMLTEGAPLEELRGKTITAVFEVQEVKRLELPEMTAELLQEIGGFESVAELRDAVKESLEKRLEYQQHQSAREQITGKLTVGADWDLPPDLLRRQGRREMQRALMELQRSGFSDEEIKSRENELRQNILGNTARALKEHFIFERIAEEEKIEPVEGDYDTEIALIAQQSEQTPRRVRARLEKEGAMDVLRNQIIERKVIDLILSHAEFNEVPYTPEGIVAEAIDQGVGGAEESAIPQAQPETGHAPYEEGAKAAGESHWPPKS